MSVTAASLAKVRLLPAVAVGAVLWHVLACVESPMSFSPEGDLAFTVVESISEKGRDLDHWIETDVRTYRLMILEADGELREIERTSTHQLSAPAYSPDGKHIAYLRVPLLTPADQERIESLFETRKGKNQATKKDEQAAAWIHFAPEGSSQGAPQSPAWRPLGVRPWDGSPPAADPSGGGLLPLQLIIRTTGGELVRSFPIHVPFVVERGKDADRENYDPQYFYNYVLNRPEYDPRGEWIYFWANFQVFAVDLAAGEVHRFDELSWGVKLSPDGRIIASLTENSLDLVQTDGNRVVRARRIRESDVPGALAWVDEGTLAVEGDKEIDLYSKEGIHLRSLAVPPFDEDDKLMTLATSPDGRYMAVAAGERARFITSAGEVIGETQTYEDMVLSHPAFTPDSKQVAIKLVRKEQSYFHTEAIVFYSLTGDELSRVPIPRVAPRAEQAQEKP